MHTVILCYRHYLVHFSGFSIVLLPQHIKFSHINTLCWVVSNIWLGFTIGETVSAVLMQALPHWRVSLVSILRVHMPGLSPASSWVQSQVEQRAGQWHLYQNKAGSFLCRGDELKEKVDHQDFFFFFLLNKSQKVDVTKHSSQTFCLRKIVLNWSN